MSDFNIINANAHAIEELTKAWAKLFEHTFDAIPTPPVPHVQTPAQRRLLLPDGQTVNPDDIRDIYAQTEPHGVNFTDRQGMSGHIECATADEAARLCHWMLEQCGITVVAFPGSETAP